MRFYFTEMRNQLFEQFLKKFRLRYWICIAFFGLAWMVLSKWSENFSSGSLLHYLIKDGASFSVIFAIGLFGRLISITTSLATRYNDAEHRLEDIITERKEFLKGMQWMYIVWMVILGTILIVNIFNKNEGSTYWSTALLIVYQIFFAFAYLIRTKDDKDLNSLKAKLNQVLDMPKAKPA